MLQRLQALGVGGHPRYLDLTLGKEGRVTFVREPSDGNIHRYVCEQTGQKWAIEFTGSNWNLAVWLLLADSTMFLCGRGTHGKLRRVIEILSDTVAHIRAQSIPMAVDVHAHCDNF